MGMEHIFSSYLDTLLKHLDSDVDVDVETLLGELRADVLKNLDQRQSQQLVQILLEIKQRQHDLRHLKHKQQSQSQQGSGQSLIATTAGSEVKVGSAVRAGRGEQSMIDVETSAAVAAVPVASLARAATTVAHAGAKVKALSASPEDTVAPAAPIAAAVSSGGNAETNTAQPLASSVGEFDPKNPNEFFNRMINYIFEHPQFIHEQTVKCARMFGWTSEQQQQLQQVMQQIVVVRQKCLQKKAVAKTKAKRAVTGTGTSHLDPAFVTVTEDLALTDPHSKNKSALGDQASQTLTRNDNQGEAKNGIAKVRSHEDDDGSYQGRKDSSGQDSLLLKERAALRFVRGAQVNVHSDVITQARNQLFRREHEQEAQELQRMQGLLTSLEGYFNLLEDMSRKLRKDSVNYYRDRAEKGDLGIDDSDCLPTQEALKRLDELEARGFRNAAGAKDAHAQGQSAVGAAGGASGVADDGAVLQQQTTTGYDSNDLRHLGAQMLSSISLSHNDPSVDPVIGAGAVVSTGASNETASNAQGASLPADPQIDTAASLIDVSIPQMQAVQASDRLAPAVELDASSALGTRDTREQGSEPLKSSTGLNSSMQAMQVVAVNAVPTNGNSAVQRASALYDAAAQGDQVVTEIAAQAPQARVTLAQKNDPLSAFATLDAIEQHFTTQQQSFPMHRADKWYVISQNKVLQVGKRSVKLLDALPIKLLTNSVRNQDGLTDFVKRSSYTFKPALSSRLGRNNIPITELIEDQCDVTIRQKSDDKLKAQMLQTAAEIEEEQDIDSDCWEDLADLPHPTAVGQSICFIKLVPHLSLSAVVAASLLTPQQLIAQYQPQGQQLPPQIQQVTPPQLSPQVVQQVPSQAMPQQMSPQVPPQQGAQGAQGSLPPQGQVQGGVPATPVVGNAAVVTATTTVQPHSEQFSAMADDEAMDDESMGFVSSSAGAQGGSWDGVDFAGDDPDEYGDYGGSFSGDMELDLDSALNDEAQLEQAEANADGANEVAATTTSHAVLKNNDTEVNAVGLERLTISDYLPQVEAQDPWYRIVLQVFASEPMVSAVLSRVACTSDPQNGAHWILQVDRNEDVSLLPDIMMHLQQYKDLLPHNMAGVDRVALFWFLVQKRIESSLGIALTFSVEQVAGVSERAPLKQAEFFARQAVEQTRGQLLQVQGLGSLLSMFKEDLQTVNLELYRKSSDEDKDKSKTA